MMRVEPEAVKLTDYTTNGQRPDGVTQIPDGVEYRARGCLQRPDLVVRVVRLERAEARRVWPLFKPHLPRGRPCPRAGK